MSSIGVGGWVERASRPRGRRRSAGRLAVPVAIGSIIGSYERLGKRARALPRSAAFPVGVDSPGEARAPPRADRALAYFRRQALTEPPVSDWGHSPIQRPRLCVTLLQRFTVQPMRRAAACQTASCAWPGPRACATLSGCLPRTLAARS